MNEVYKKILILRDNPKPLLKHTLFFAHKNFSVAQNFKVFSTEIAQRIFIGKIKRPQFFLATLQKDPVYPIALLVGDPFVKFFAACREDKIPASLALKILIDKNFPSFHFLPQSRFLHNHNNPVYAWLAPQHISNFWETLNLGEPPKIYDQTLSKEEEAFKQQNKSSIKKIYASDFELYDQIKSPAQIVSVKQSPTMLDMLARFGSSAISFALSGFATTPPDILATREATCRACDQWDAKALNGTGRCKKCGCSTWAKLRMATEQCPIGKWKRVSDTPTDQESTPELETTNQ